MYVNTWYGWFTSIYYNDAILYACKLVYEDIYLVNVGQMMSCITIMATFCIIILFINGCTYICSLTTIIAVKGFTVQAKNWMSMYKCNH